MKAGTMGADLGPAHRGHMRLLRWATLLLLCAGLVGLLGGCSSSPTREQATADQPDEIADAVPKVEPRSRGGNPASYVVFGKRYYTKPDSKGHVERGLASWYGPGFHGRKTSSGERYDMHAMTAAHKTLPLPTYAKVTNLDNGRSAVVRINDRGPFHGPRIIDLSRAAASKLGVIAQGTARVEVRALDPSEPASDAPNPFLVAGNKAPKQARPEAARTSYGFLDGFDGPASAAPRPEPMVAAKAAPQDRSLAAVAARVDSQSRASSRTPARQLVVSKPATPKRASPAVRPAPNKQEPAPVVAATSKKTGEPPASNGGMYLQVGAFGNRSNAEQLRTRLAKELSRQQLQVRSIGGGASSLYKVQVGPFKSRSKASDLSQQLATLGVTQAHVVVE